MRCTKSETLFEGLLDGTLTALQRRDVETHLEKCARCKSVLEELRVIDALLLSPRVLEPAPNFTFKTMADIRGMPAPKTHFRLPPWLWLGIYLALSWIAIGAWFAVGRPDAPAALALGLGALQHVAGAFSGIGRAIGAGLGYTGIASIVTIVLALDMGLVALVYFAPRLIARLARNESA